MPNKLTWEQARRLFYRVARTNHGRCSNCGQDISPGDRYYMTYSRSVKNHPVHLDCKEATK